MIAKKIRILFIYFLTDVSGVESLVSKMDSLVESCDKRVNEILCGLKDRIRGDGVSGFFWREKKRASRIRF